MKTIAQLRAASQDVVGLSRAVYPLCIAGKLTKRMQVLVAERQQLTADLVALQTQLPATPPTTAEQGDQPQRPTTIAGRGERAAAEQERDAAIAEVATKLEAKQAEVDKLRELMNEHLSPVTLTTKRSDVWIAWQAEHPARPDNDDDDKAGCNFDDLIADLGDHIVEVSEQPVTELEEGDLEWVLARAGYGDKREMAWMVLRLQYGTVSVPK